MKLLKWANHSNTIEPVHYALLKLAPSRCKVTGKGYFSIGGIGEEEDKFCGTVVSKQWLFCAWYGIGILPGTDTHWAV